jgi:hypothetical protein
MDETEKVLGQVLEYGDPAEKMMHAKVKKALSSNQSRYLSKYSQSVTKLISRLTRKEAAEVSSLRKTLAKLREKGKNMSKQDVLTVGDPALKRLKELLLIEHTAIMEKDKSLETLREQLSIVARWNKQCLEGIGTEKPKKKAGKGIPVEATPFPLKLERLEMIVRTELTVGKKGRSVLRKNEKLSSQIDGGEALGILDFNVLRMVVGLKPLKVDTRLCAAARDHSNDMRTVGFFAHESPVPDKKSFTDRARRFKTRASGENIAMGRFDALATNMQWWHSPGHHLNMLRKGIKGIALGRSGKYWTQMLQ